MRQQIQMREIHQMSPRPMPKERNRNQQPDDKHNNFEESQEKCQEVTMGIGYLRSLEKQVNGDRKK
jgi:hypothetical protein